MVFDVKVIAEEEKMRRHGGRYGEERPAKSVSLVGMHTPATWLFKTPANKKQNSSQAENQYHQDSYWRITADAVDVWRRFSYLFHHHSWSIVCFLFPQVLWSPTFLLPPTLPLDLKAYQLVFNYQSIILLFSNFCLRSFTFYCTFIQCLGFKFWQPCAEFSHCNSEN